MIECAYFHDEEHEAWNGYVVADPAVNATSGAISPSIPGSFDQMAEMIATAWNAKHRAGQASITVHDLSWTETDPYRDPHGDGDLTHDDMIEGHVWSGPPDGPPDVVLGGPAEVVPVEEIRRPE